MTMIKDEDNNFRKSLLFTLGQEGGYANDKRDKGGETMMGITAGTLARAYKAGLVSCKSVTELTREDAEEIYRCFYWEPSKASVMPWPLCAVHFDAAVNHGVGGASKLMQRTLNGIYGVGLAVDGALGPISMRAMLEAMDVKGIKALCMAYIDERRKLFERLAAKDESQRCFLKGWLNRIKHNKKLVEESMPE